MMNKKRKEKKIRINIFDFLYYLLDTGVCGVESMLMPLFWLFFLILSLILPLSNPSIIKGGIAIAIGAGLIDLLMRCYFDKREAAIRKHFDKTKYSKPSWQWGVLALWIFLWFIVPLIIIFLTRHQ